MAKIYVHTAFRLLQENGEHREFKVGNHTVDDDVAGHWYVKAHTGKPDEDDADDKAKVEAEAANKKK